MLQTLNILIFPLPPCRLKVFGGRRKTHPTRKLNRQAHLALPLVFRKTKNSAFLLIDLWTISNNRSGCHGVQKAAHHPAFSHNIPWSGTIVRPKTLARLYSPPTHDLLHICPCVQSPSSPYLPTANQRLSAFVVCPCRCLEHPLRNTFAVQGSPQTTHSQLSCAERAGRAVSGVWDIGSARVQY